jgi:hypothetical protein
VVEVIELVIKQLSAVVNIIILPPFAGQSLASITCNDAHIWILSFGGILKAQKRYEL